MKTIVSPVDQAGNIMFSAFLNLAEQHKGTFMLMVPGGRSVVPFFTTWAERCKDIPLSFYTDLHIFMVDERRVALDDPESNYKLFMDSVGHLLVEQSLVRSDQIHPYVNDEEDVNGSVSAYETSIRSVKTTPDLVVLGVGEDGHVGGLPPKHHVLLEKEKLYLSLDDSPKPPPKRVTASLPLLQASANTWLLFYGSGKQDAYNAFMQTDEHLLPVHAVKQAGEVIVFTNLSYEER